jgi:hypothetical protein
MRTRKRTGNVLCNGASCPSLVPIASSISRSPAIPGTTRALHCGSVVGVDWRNWLAGLPHQTSSNSCPLVAAKLGAVQVALHLGHFDQQQNTGRAGSRVELSRRSAGTVGLGPWRGQSCDRRIVWGHGRVVPCARLQCPLMTLRDLQVHNHVVAPADRMAVGLPQ